MFGMLMKNDVTCDFRQQLISVDPQLSSRVEIVNHADYCLDYDMLL